MPWVPYSVWSAPGRPAVVTLPREIDIANCGKVHGALMRALDTGATVVIADMTGTGFCDCAAVSTFAAIQARAAAAGTQLRVAVASPAVRRTLHLIAAGQRLDLYPDLAAAVAGPPAPGNNTGTAGNRRGTAGRRGLRLIPGEGSASGPRTRLPGLSLITGMRQRKDPAAPGPGSPA